jgi:hypothetical protein
MHHRWDVPSARNVPSHCGGCGNANVPESEGGSCANKECKLHLMKGALLATVWPLLAFIRLKV